MAERTLPTYRATRRDTVAVAIANRVLTLLATREYRATLARLIDDGWRYRVARRTLSDLCFGAVLEDWKWWRPSWSSGRYEGLAAAEELLSPSACGSPPTPGC